MTREAAGAVTAVPWVPTTAAPAPTSHLHPRMKLVLIGKLPRDLAQGRLVERIFEAAAGLNFTNAVL